MLILTRKRDESIVISKEIVVTVLRIHGKQVQLGIAAPAHVRVYREELYERLNAGNQSPQAEPTAAEVI